MINPTTTPTEIETYIKDHFAHLEDPHAAAGNCLSVCQQIQGVFPNLKLIKGVVSSPTNIDNIMGAHYDKQYPHAWLKADCGTIIDPTVSQFCLLGELNYHEFDDTKQTKRCHFCGKYYQSDDITCGHSECIAELENEW